jgi:4-hydroxymandelate oxidase
VNGILVSNHGGRQLDMTLSSVETLPEIAAAVAGRTELYLDSGIRRGSDVLKALALGVRAVGIGRPLFWGLAVDGAEGVHGVLEILRRELDRAMAFCGQTSVREVDSHIMGFPHDGGTRDLDF